MCQHIILFMCEVVEICEIQYTILWFYLYGLDISYASSRWQASKASRNLLSANNLVNVVKYAF